MGFGDTAPPQGFSMNVGLDPIGEYVEKRFAELQGNRTNWESLWDEVARYIIPNKNDIWDNQTKGERKTDHLYDSTAKRNNNELASALHSMLTNPTTKWFELTTGVRELDSDRDVRIWLQAVVEIMHKTLNNSNFHEEVLETYQELGSFGTGPIRVEDDPIEVLRFYARPIYKCFIAENARKQIDVVIRKYKFSIRQIFQKFGDAAFTKEMHDQLRDAPTTEHEILHAVGPRIDLMHAGLLQGKQMRKADFPYYSLEVLRSSRRVLNDPRMGFHEFPYAVPRWTKTAGETYGRSPGMDVLPDIKTINAMKKVILQGAQVAIAPPLQLEDNSNLRPIKFRPFGVNYRRPGSAPIEPIMTGANPGIGFDLLANIGESINQGFLIHQLRMAQQDRMTATEVVQRRDEQLRGLGGILGRLQNELLSPLINRSFGIMSRAGIFPQIPTIMANLPKMEIKYTSMLAKAQITGEAEAVQRALGQVMPILESQPEVMDNIDGDQLLRINFDVFGVDERFLRSKDDVQQIRDSRAEQMQAQEQQQAGAAESEQMRNVAPLMKAMQNQS